METNVSIPTRILRAVVSLLAYWRRAVDQFCEHYQQGRNHQGLVNKIIDQEFGPSGEGGVQCRERLGGLLRFCYLDPA